MAEVTKENFQEVRKDDGKKQDFLDCCLTFCPSSVLSITYDPAALAFKAYIQSLYEQELVPMKARDESLHIGAMDFHFSTIPVLPYLGNGNRHPIFVSDEAFRKYGVLEIFLNVLVDHEGRHCSDFQQGIGTNGNKIDASNAFLLQPITFRSILELRATHNQLEAARTNGIVREDYLAFTELELNFAYDRLRAITPHNNFERNLLMHMGSLI